ncbi:hypothetical protein [Acidipila sp. EB88]|uniref:hypothetical protein n=1 Tax=Acidipila sp. EB88 TaxID=2305226 RepID=UPI000F5FF9FA|nr:hypothetical protein [Acidipila sp. EB88]RRA47801.1 hypothetical protein D1Y84_05350 [Acidipila sp. EB88]
MGRPSVGVAAEHELPRRGGVRGMLLGTRKPARMGIALAWGLLAALADAQTTTATLHGVVVDSETRQPIARVLVESPTGGAGVLTDQAGRFTFAGVAEGTVIVRCRRPGYFDPGSDDPEATQQVLAAAGGGEQRLVLEKAAALRGELLLSDGDVPAGMRVDLYKDHADEGWRRWQLVQTVAAQGDGSFAFEGLKAGNYLLHAQGSLDPLALQDPGASPGVRSGYAPAYAPAGGEMAGATVFALHPGHAAEARLRVARVAFYPVSVRLNGEGANGFEVTGNGFTHWTPRRVRGGDLLETELPSGSYVLHTMGRGRQQPSGELPFHVDGQQLQGLSMTLADAAPMTVETQVEANGTDAGESAGTGTATGTAGPPHVSQLRFVPLDAPDQPAVGLSVQEDASGAGVIREGVRPGRYWVTAVVRGGYVSALSSGGVDLLAHALVVAPGTSPSFVAALRQDGGQVQVTRTGEALERGAAVQLIPLSADGVARILPVISAEDESQQGANPALAEIVPGDYLAIVTANRDGIAFREPGVLRELKGERVTVRAGQLTQATVSTMTQAPPATEAGSL